MSVTTSGENLASDTQSCDGGSMCLELALEGERLCKAGDCRAGVAFFQAAIQAGTDDLRTLSAIYSQLGNAYFYLGDYNKAMQYHKHDLTLARSMGDKLGEAKASGNLGNTLKVMGKFSEAIACCRRHLELSRELGDRASEGRALYNLGNVFHAQGKQLARQPSAGAEPPHLANEVREALQHALNYYEENLELMRGVGDRAAMGRACGNLGNTCYLLGDFARAIRYHTERLNIARDTGDKPAERRANSNLANSHIFLGQFENAAEHYKRTLALAEELGEAAVEAQACYALGNTYTLLRAHRQAEQYHARHLAAARRLGDRVGEARACWSLGNAHAALHNHEKALYFATEHYTLSKELGDALGMATAQMNIADLRKVLGLPADESVEAAPAAARGAASPETPFGALRVRRQSMEQLSLIQLTPDGTGGGRREDAADAMLALVARCQANRLDDQRAAPPPPHPPPHTPPPDKENCQPDTDKSDPDVDMALYRPGGRIYPPMRNSISLPGLISVSRAMAAAPPSVAQPGAPPAAPPAAPAAAPPLAPDDDLLDMIARVQGSRLEEQRTALPPPPPPAAARTVPDDDFFALIMRAQSTRMEDQRATIPLRENKNKTNSKK